MVGEARWREPRCETSSKQRPAECGLLWCVLRSNQAVYHHRECADRAGFMSTLQSLLYLFTGQIPQGFCSCRKKKNLNSSHREQTVAVGFVLAKCEEWLMVRSTVPGYIRSAPSLLYFNQIGHGCLGLYLCRLFLFIKHSLWAWETCSITISSHSVFSFVATTGSGSENTGWLQCCVWALREGWGWFFFQ